MPASGKAVERLVSLGIKYGPLAYEGLRRSRGPVQEMAGTQMARRGARAAAMEHASHLVDGSILPVYDGDTRVWVVFSGDTPVGSHPVVRTPLEKLLQHYDLTKRLRPEEVRPARRLPAVRRPRGTA